MMDHLLNCTSFKNYIYWWWLFNILPNMHWILMGYRIVQEMQLHTKLSYCTSPFAKNEKNFQKEVLFVTLLNDVDNGKASHVTSSKQGWFIQRRLPVQVNRLWSSQKLDGYHKQSTFERVVQQQWIRMDSRLPTSVCVVWVVTGKAGCSRRHQHAGGK